MITQDERRYVLELLINFQRPLADLTKSVHELPWDCDEPLVRMSASHAIHAIQLVFSKEISPGELSQWADLIEMREDIEIEGEPAAPLREFVYETATPEFFPVTDEFLDSWIETLRSSCSL